MKLNQTVFFIFFTLGMLGQASAQVADTKLSAHIPKEHQHAVKINLLSPFYGTLNLSWQKVINSNANFQITASYTDFDSYGSTADEDSDGDDYYSTTQTVNGAYTTEVTTSKMITGQRTQGFAVTPEYRYMLNGRNLTGFYIAPFGRYMYYQYSREYEITTQEYTYLTSQPYSGGTYGNSTLTEGSDLYTYHTLGLGVTVGKQIMFKQKVVIDFFAGPVYSILLASNHNIQSTSDIVIGSGIPNVYLRGYGVRAGITIGLAY